MWTYEHHLETPASAEAIWQLYSDVSTWPAWDAGITEITLNGQFETGTRGVLSPEGQGPLPFVLTDVRAGEGFQDLTEIPGADIVVHFTHLLEPLPGGGTRITHRVAIEGPAADSLGPQVGPGITGGIPDTMAALARMAAELPERR